MNKGIAIAGIIIVDYVKMIDHYPQKGMAAKISDVTKSIGGCVPNTSINLSIMDPSIKIQALGMVGDDGNGNYIIEELAKRNIDVQGIIKNADSITPFSDVMTMSGTGERTFFFIRGANEKYSIQDVKLPVDADIFHIGYLTHLDGMLQKDAEYGNEIARLLSSVREHGCKTSIDLAGVKDPEYLRQLAIPSLPYCDYVIINEIEAGMLAGMEVRDENSEVIPENIEEAAKKILQYGVQEAVVIHSPEGGWMGLKNGEMYYSPSLDLPKDYIKGTVGAGDSFCAGILYSIYHEKSPKEALEIAAACAAANLSEKNSIDGMRKYEDVMKLSQMYGRNKEK